MDGPKLPAAYSPELPASWVFVDDVVNWQGFEVAGELWRVGLAVSEKMSRDWRRSGLFIWIGDSVTLVAKNLELSPEVRIVFRAIEDGVAALLFEQGRPHTILVQRNGADFRVTDGEPRVVRRRPARIG